MIMIMIMIMIIIIIIIIIIPLFTLGSIYSTYASRVEQVTETNNSNITGLRIPTGRRQTSWLFTSVIEDVNS